MLTRGRSVRRIRVETPIALSSFRSSQIRYRLQIHSFDLVSLTTAATSCILIMARGNRAGRGRGGDRGGQRGRGFSQNGRGRGRGGFNPIDDLDFTVYDFDESM